MDCTALLCLLCMLCSHRLYRLRGSISEAQQVSAEAIIQGLHTSLANEKYMRQNAHAKLHHANDTVQAMIG